MELKVENKISAQTAEKLTENVNKITDEKIEKSLNYDELSKEEQKAVDEFNAKIDVMDSIESNSVKYVLILTLELKTRLKRV